MMKLFLRFGKFAGYVINDNVILYGSNLGRTVIIAAAILVYAPIAFYNMLLALLASAVVATVISMLIPRVFSMVQKLLLDKIETNHAMQVTVDDVSKLSKLGIGGTHHVFTLFADQKPMVVFVPFRENDLALYRMSQ